MWRMIILEEKVLELLEPLLNKCNKEGFILYDEAIESGEVALEHLQEIELGGYTFVVCLGCSKFVLEGDDFPFVVKIPIRFYSDCSGDENEAVTEMDNIIESERRMWNKFPTRLKKICLENKKIGQINGIPIYIQQRVPITKDFTYIKMPQEKTLKKTGNVLAKLRLPLPIGVSNEIVYGLVYEDYGKKYVRELAAFHIQDLHCANVGYIKNQIKIFDYGGYPIESTNTEKLLEFDIF